MENKELVTITGIGEVNALLGTVPTRLVKAAFAKALTKACIPIVADLEIRTPVSAKNTLFDDETFAEIRGTGTGELKAHLMSGVNIHSDGKGGVAQVGFGKMGNIARLVNTGHRMIGHKPDLKDLGAPVPAYPFMAQSAEATADAAIAEFAETLVEILKSEI